MERFAFVIHPIDVRKDVSRKFPVAGKLPESWVAAGFSLMKPFVVSHITGIRSLTGEEAEGWFIGCPLTPEQLLHFPYSRVLEKLVACARIAEGLGAKVMGLGALTSVAGDAGITLAQRAGIAITTGNSYTVATAVEGARRGAEEMGFSLEEAHVAVVGAAGSIGRTCALLLAPDAKSVTLIGRNAEKLAPVAEAVRERNPRVRIAKSVADGLREADVVVTVTSAADAVILPEHLKRGAVVCDVARPRDVSVKVARERNDVLVIEGGVVAVPGAMHLRKTDSKGQDKDDPREFSFGFPEGTAYACMSETMLLALERRYESFTLGREVSVEQVEEMWRLAARHGFKLAGFRSFESAVTQEHIDAVRRAAGRKIE